VNDLGRPPYAHDMAPAIERETTAWLASHPRFDVAAYSQHMASFLLDLYGSVIPRYDPLHVRVPPPPLEWRPGYALHRKKIKILSSLRPGDRELAFELRRARRLAHLSQEAIARRVGVDQSRVARWEKLRERIPQWQRPKIRKLVLQLTAPSA
jgi:hypothetical protein